MEITTADMERESKVFWDDLDVAIFLIANIAKLYPRLKEVDRSKILQIIAKRIIVDAEGTILDHELRSPFMYLCSIVSGLQNLQIEQCGSEQLRPGAPNEIHLEPHSISFEQFLAMLRFESRSKPAELPGELMEGWSG